MPFKLFDSLVQIASYPVTGEFFQAFINITGLQFFQQNAFIQPRLGHYVYTIINNAGKILLDKYLTWIFVSAAFLQAMPTA